MSYRTFVNIIEIGCNRSDPFEDTERRTFGINITVDWQGCNRSDPFEDTESCAIAPVVPRKTAKVATVPIRLRILKVDLIDSQDDLWETVATVPIRLRILKETLRTLLGER